MTDRDGDSRMQDQDESGSEHSSRSSSMFPHETVSTPPQSQPSNVSPIDKEDTPMVEANDQAQQLYSGPEETNSFAPRTNMMGFTVETDENAPGWAWKNRRAIDEFDKMSNAMVDRKFSLEEFGDLVLGQLRAQEADYDPFALTYSLNETQ